MFKFRLISWILLSLFLLVACTQSEPNEELVTVEATQPVATVTPVEPTQAPTETPVPAEPVTDTVDAFVEQLQMIVSSQDYPAMQVLMSDPILVAGWRSEGRVYEPAQMVTEWQNNALPTPTAVQFTDLTDEELTALLGQPPASLLGPESTVVMTLHSTGWGSEGNDEAILFVTQEEDGYAWSAFLYTFGSFAGTDGVPAGDLIPFIETDVMFVMAQQDVVMYSGPGDTYDEIGGIFDGQTALVTGQSEDGAWWRVICPDDSVGNCWVTADPAFTLPMGGGDMQGRLITDEPIFVGGDLQFSAWSPDGRYLAYFEYTEDQVASGDVEGLRGSYPGTFVFYDTETGEKCMDYPFSGLFNYEGPGRGTQWLWLPDGQLLLNLPDGQLLQTDAPCVAGEDIAALFPIPIASLGDFSPDEKWLVIASETQYLLYDWVAREVQPIAEVQPDLFNNLIWSPDSQHISITLAGNYTGERDPIGGTRVIDVATGAIIAQYDWEPANALDGTFGGPVWVNNEAFVVTLSLDQGPFLMTVDGAVEPLLPLFDETFDRDNYWPPVDVLADVENSRYAILRSNEGREGPAKLYIVTQGADLIQMLEPASTTFRIFPDGTLGYETNGSFWTRSVFDVEAEFVARPGSANPWLQTDSELVAGASGNVVSIQDSTSGELVDRLQIEGYEANYYLNAILSPNNQWVAIFVIDPQYGLGKALFVVPLADN